VLIVMDANGEPLTGTIFLNPKPTLNPKTNVPRQVPVGEGDQPRGEAPQHGRVQGLQDQAEEAGAAHPPFRQVIQAKGGPSLLSATCLPACCTARKGPGWRDPLIAAEPLIVSTGRELADPKVVDWNKICFKQRLAGLGKFRDVEGCNPHRKQSTLYCWGGGTGKLTSTVVQSSVCGAERRWRAICKSSTAVETAPLDN